MFRRVLWVFLTIAVAAMAAAQPDFYHRPSFLAGRTLLTLSLFEEVRTELKTTTDLNAKEDGILEKLSGEVQDAFQNANGDFASVRPAVEKINAKYDEEVVKLLSADQVARLKQLFVQYNGALAIPNVVIAKDLGITDDQKTKIKQAQDDNNKKMMESFANGGNGGSPEDMQKNMAKLQEELKAALEKLLTDDQKTKLKTMEGTKFTFKKVPAEGG